MNSNKLVRLSDMEEMIRKHMGKYSEELLRNPLSNYSSGKSIALHELLSSLSSLPTQNEWIPVSERLPHDDDFIIMCDGHESCPGFFMQGQFFSTPNTVVIGVKLWMPLPNPPTN